MSEQRLRKMSAKADKAGRLLVKVGRYCTALGAIAYAVSLLANWTLMHRERADYADEDL